jgi:molybdopterin converting factor small subunit
VPVRLEFFGIPRARVGVAQMVVEAGTVREALRAAVALVPALGECCTEAGDLNSACIVNLDGLQFVSDVETPVRDGQTILLLSKDAGG